MFILNLKILNLSFLFLLSNFSFSQNDISFDRPGITDLFNTVEKSKLQFEIGYDYFNQLKNQSKIPTVTTRFGINNSMELRFVIDYGFYSHSTINNFDSLGINAVSLGLKKSFFTSSNWNFSMMTNFKYGKTSDKKNYYGVDLLMIIQRNINNLDFICNVGVINENLNFKNKFFIGNCISYDLSENHAMFVEDFFFIFNEKKYEHGNIIGYTFQKKKYQFDFSIGSIKVKKGNIFIGLGYSFLI